MKRIIIFLTIVIFASFLFAGATDDIQVYLDTSPSDGERLQYDSLLRKWKNVTSSDSIYTRVIIVSSLTAGRVVLVGTDGLLVDSANLVFSGSVFDLAGSMELTGNIKLIDNKYIGIAAAERLVFDTSGYVTLIGADLRIPDGSLAIGTDTADSTLTVDGSGHFTGDLVVDGSITGEKAGTWGYISAMDTTTCTSADTWYTMQGTWANPVLENFTGDATGITYTGTTTKYFVIEWHAGMYGDTNGITPHIGIFKNGVYVDGSIFGSYLKTANEGQAFSGNCVVELATNDLITVVIKSDGAGDILTVGHFSSIIRPFFD